MPRLLDDVINVDVPQLEGLPRDQIGRDLIEYIQEADHMGWDGFTQQEVNAVGKFITDFTEYARANRR